MQSARQKTVKNASAHSKYGIKDIYIPYFLFFEYRKIFDF